MLKNKWVFAIIIALFANIAMAEVPKARAEKVAKLLEVSHFDNLIEDQRKMMVDAISKQVPLKGHAKEIGDLYSEIMDIPSLKKEMITLYCETFTDDEIDEMIKFNESALGQKIHKKLPGMNKKLMAKMQSNLQQNQKKIQDLFMSIAMDAHNSDK